MSKLMIVTKSEKWKMTLRQWLSVAKGKRRMPEDIEYTRISPVYVGNATPFFIRLITLRRFEDVEGMELWVARKMTEEEIKQMMEAKELSLSVP